MSVRPKFRASFPDVSNITFDYSSQTTQYFKVHLNIFFRSNNKAKGRLKIKFIKQSRHK